MKMKCIKISLLIVSALSVNFSFAQWTEDASGVHLTDPNKYVGIGTSKPSAQLDVNNNILLGLDEPAYGVRIKANWPSHTGGWARGFYIANEDNSKNYFSVGVTGLATAGVTNMSYAWLGKDYNNAYMFFLPNGNVGIGTANPTEKLSVNGNIEIQNGANTTIGYVFNNTGALNLQANSGSTALEVGTSAALPIYFYTNGYANRRMTINAAGNIGIGTTSPSSKLEINSTNTLSYPVMGNTYGTLHIAPEVGSVANSSAAITFGAAQSVSGAQAGIYVQSSGDYGTKMYFGTTNRYVIGAQSQMMIDHTGNVGIGTTTPTEKLSVNGNIKAKKLIVTQTGWADYVFDKAYKLMSVDSLSTYINTHKHLPEMPTTKDVQDHGVDVGNNQTLLLKKIEELTLYIIEQHKTMKDQQQQIIEQNKRLQKLEKSKN